MRRKSVIAIMLLAIAAVVLIYVGFNLLRSRRPMVSQGAIGKSAAGVPVATSQIKATLESSLGLTCQVETFGGVNVDYQGWSCRGASIDPNTRVDIWSRANDPEKADLVWLVTDRSNPDKTQALIFSVIAAAMPKADVQAARKWVLETLPSWKEGSRWAETMVDNVPIALQIPSDTRLQLMIGASR